ncbi:ABC transporter ATP-binding protein [Candidatus Woesearchaeota archaeon]|nr:ABC transporter ATP-binding protein [Candidatus Woesearchaeota archaeon]
MGKALLMVENVSKTYGQKEVLKNLSLDIEPGEIFGVIGMSGAGKSTLMNIITGIIGPDTGKVLFKHPKSEHYTEVSKHMNLAKKIFGFATQDPSFYPYLTVEENLDYFATMFGLAPNVIKNNITTALKLTALDRERNTAAKDLSGGMQKRLDISCAIVNDPDVLLLDEPTADLDPVLRDQMWSLIKKINATGTTIIVASHFIEELEEFCDRICVLHDKKIAIIGSVEDVKKKFGTFEEIHIESAPGKYDRLIKHIHTGKAGKGIVSMKDEGHKIIIYTKDSESILHDVLHTIETHNEKLLNLHIVKVSIEKIFTNLINRGER